MVQWLRMQVLGIWRSLVRTLVIYKFFFDIFCTPFLPRGDCSIRVSRSCFCFIMIMIMIMKHLVSAEHL